MAKKKTNKHIKRFNEKRHYTVADAAHVIGVSRQQIHKWIDSGVLNSAFKYAKPRSNKENFWAVYKWNVKEVKEKHRAAYGGEYISDTFPHHRFIIYSVVVSRFNYSMSKDFCERYGLHFISKGSCMNLIKYLSNRIKPYSSTIAAAVTTKNFTLFNYDDPEWEPIMKDLEIWELYQDFDGIPWTIFTQNITKHFMDVCVTRLSNDEVQQFFHERFDIDLTLHEISMYRNYIFDTRIMKKSQIELYLDTIGPDEASFKRGMLRGDMASFKYKIGLTDRYEMKDSTIHRHSVINEKFDMIADDVDSPLTRYKAAGALSSFGKSAIDHEKQIYEHEDRNPAADGAEGTIQKMILDYRVEEKNDAISMDQYAEEYGGKIISGNAKKKYGENNGDKDENNGAGVNAS